MGSLKLEIPIWGNLMISTIDVQGHVEIEIDNEKDYTYINKQQAEQIIAHLQEQFNLKQATT